MSSFLKEIHGHLALKRQSALNSLFLQHGFIDVDSQGTITAWRIRSHSCGLSAHIYLADEHLQSAAIALIQTHASAYGISQIFTKEEVIQRFGLDGDFSLVVETDGYTEFTDTPLGQPLKSFTYQIEGLNRRC